MGSAFLVSLLFFYMIACAVWDAHLQLWCAVYHYRRRQTSSWPGAQPFAPTMAVMVSLTSLTLWPLYQTGASVSATQRQLPAATMTPLS